MTPIHRTPRRARGFTLLELLVVMTIIGILASIAVPALMNLPRRAKESVLKTNLRQIRSALEQYLGDKGRYPASLDALVPRYLKRIPEDPFTKDNTSWVPIYEDQEEGEGGDDFVPGPVPDGEQEPGVQDVRSASPETALDGTKYADW